METLQILGWIYLGIVLGGMGAVVGLSLFQVRHVADLKATIRDLRLQRTLLKEEIFRLTKEANQPQEKEEIGRENHEKSRWIF